MTSITKHQQPTGVQGNPMPHMWTAHRLRIVRSLRRLFGHHCQRASIMAIAEQMSDASLQEWLETEMQHRRG